VKERTISSLLQNRNAKNEVSVEKKQKESVVLTIEFPAILVETPKKVKSKINKEENVEKMDENKLKQAEELVNVLSGVDPNQIKRIKSDRGLIERTESSKVVLTEDNRQILND
jgi:hypothetical protein